MKPFIKKKLMYVYRLTEVKENGGGLIEMGSLVVELYNSTYCRLCGEENNDGIFIFNGCSQPDNLSLVINQYLPVKVSSIRSFLFDYHFGILN